MKGPKQQWQSLRHAEKFLPALVGVGVVVILLALQQLRTENKVGNVSTSSNQNNSFSINERRSRDQQDHMNRMQAEARQRYADQLDRAQKAYDLAKSNKDKDVSAYVHAAVDLASVCRNARDNDRAGQVYEEAYDTYTKLDKNSPDEPQCRVELFSHIGLLPYNSFDQKFEQLFRINEQKTPSAATTETDNMIATAIREHENQRPPDSTSSHTFGRRQDETKFWSSVIAIRTEVRGQNDPSLKFLLHQYARACESNNDLVEAENAFKRAASIKNDRAPDSLLNSQIDLANFYLRHQMFDKADAPTMKAIALARETSSHRPQYQFTTLIQQYNRQNRPEQSEKIVEQLLAIGGDNMVQAVDNVLDPMIQDYINSFNLSKAKLLLEKRVQASQTCVEDRKALMWRTKLSNVDLALGLDSASNQLFNEVRTAMALNGQDVDKLVEDRKALIESLKHNQQSSKKK